VITSEATQSSATFADVERSSVASLRSQGRQC
jgi:hypothetical protein